MSLAAFRKLGDAMRAALAEGESATAVAALRFLLLAGCRRMEVLALPASAVDRPANCLRFEDTKSGPQTRPVGASAFKALDEAPARNGWAFPGARGADHFVGLPKVLERLCKRAELAGVTIHVLRHSFAAAAAEMSFSELTIAGLLGHTMPGVTARYAHVPDSALVLAADRVSARIAAALDGRADQADVIKIARR